MSNKNSKLKRAMKKTTDFILNLESERSDRVPDWYEQMAMSSCHPGLSVALYSMLLEKLNTHLQKEYGDSVAKHLLS